MVFYEHESRFWQEPVNLFIINCILLIHVQGKAKRTNVNEMWCNRVVIMFEYQKRLKEYSTLDIDGVDLISFEELVWKVNHSLFVFKTIYFPQYHSFISSKVMNFFSNQIDQIPILFHNVLLMNFLLMICIILFY